MTLINLPIIKDRRTNKLLCLAFFVMAGLFLVAAGILALTSETVLAQVMCFLAGICGVFGMIYGVFWFLSWQHQRKRQQKIERAAMLFATPDDNTVDCREFILPRQMLTETARQRFWKIAAALVVTAAVVFILLYTVLLFTNGYGGILHLILLAVFCLLVILPGMVVQYTIYRKYAASVPQRIMVFPGKLIIDGNQFTASDIEKMIISSVKSANLDSSALFRKFTVKTQVKTCEYTIDYRTAANDAPRWENYDELVEAIQKWAKQHRKDLTVDYMN